MRFLTTFFYRSLQVGLLVVVVLGAMMFTLPDVSELKKNTYRAPLQVFSKDGVLFAEYGEIKRLPVTIDEVPQALIDALIVIEDQRFYKHMGVDALGVMRAIKALLLSGEKKQGASTLTMQVARNFYLTREKTYLRKINEVLLALMIEQTLSKREILELYINKVFLGARTYGFRAASKTYFAKELCDLSLSEIAILVGLPKAPSYYNPIEYPARAKARRNVILAKMHEKGVIDTDQYQQALLEPISVAYSSLYVMQRGTEYVAEMARMAAVKQWGAKAYESGYKIYTTIDFVQQKKAQTAMSVGLENELLMQDVVPKFNVADTYGSYSVDWDKALYKTPVTPSGMQPVAVLSHDKDIWVYAPREGGCIKVSLPLCQKGKTCAFQHAAFRYGDVVYMRKNRLRYTLGAVPSVQGSLVALDPKTGNVQALVGGYQFQRSHFNRALQAFRQSGSAVKPFLYTFALLKGFTMASLIPDMPIVENREGAEDWKPKNVDHDFKGVMRLRESLVLSRNLVSIRLVKALGVKRTADFLNALGISADSEQDGLSLALGSSVVTPVQLARAYTLFPNAGIFKPVHWVDKVLDVEGQVVFDEAQQKAFEALVMPESADSERDVVAGPVSYIVTDVLHDVIARGTGRRARVLKRADIYGKTGTTNQNVDAWFAGFSGDQVAVVWVGYDDRRPLSGGGAKLALPIWIDYMLSTYKGVQAFVPKPNGIVSARINPQTGQRAHASVHDSVFELFLSENIEKKQKSGEDHAYMVDTQHLEKEQEQESMEQLF